MENNTEDQIASYHHQQVIVLVNSQFRGIALNLKLGGAWTAAKVPFVDGGFSPSGGKNSNLCTRVVRYKNISILAKASPKHTLLPIKENLHV